MRLLETGESAATLLAGCGGGEGGGGSGGNRPAGGEQEVVIVGLVTRVAGTTQPPVTQSGLGAVITGIAGGTVSSLTYNAPPATPAGARSA
jgi:hypothetical protein